jgi:signal transduction histidine kinase
MTNLLSSTVSNASTKSPTARCGSELGDSDAAGEGGVPAGPESRESVPAALATPAAEEEPEVARRLRAQYAEISQLAGGLAHEIKNPLSTVSLNLDLLAEDFQNPETPRDRRVLQRVERLRHEIHRLSGILENFLRFARIQDLKLGVADLNAVVEELRDFYEPHAATKSIVMRARLAPELPPVQLDTELFKQALLNLWLNAEHAMPSGGELILTTRREGPAIVLDVIDTGVGMTEEVRARIFEAFFSTRPGGSGLGLPTTRKIVEAHEGTIRVQSEPGKGSQFTIRLPVAAHAARALDRLGPPDGLSSPRPAERS